ncbi:conserved oligomeric Golgi complex subunit 2-like [Lytechinus variegatus]|uniref:conserved oligomeric Golgi complex subunit 2-like n=1 Tax=Lytechinus variegatus TaxID=7654 RepID=UPI001BB2881B|nr:conserved oligomeric Golgi complex subunit 2-like [Lytechinus variegatus]
MSLNLKLLPIGTDQTSLCFDQDVFMRDDFDVDSFVAECRHHVQLETLREDLHIYFKTLKNAMVELINKDYADFVNLSSNLVGMDKAISNLSIPLGQLREEVMSVRCAIDEAIHDVEEKMTARNRTRQKKACLQRLMNIVKSVEKMEGILRITEDSEPQEDISIELTGQQIERVASEFNQLQYYVTQSKGLPLVEKIRPRIAAITVTLQHSLEKSFREGLEAGDTNVLRQCLRTYATIDKMRDAEALFRQIAVKPYLDEIISESFLHNHPQGLKGMYSRILDFIPKHCDLIRKVTSPSQSASGQEIVRGYDFPVNAAWPEIASSLETRTPSIFAPGNPDIFHQKFLLTQDFVNGFERQCGSQASVRRLRSHPTYSAFMTKWSLPVYFQLRFQEIAGQFEAALMSPFSISPDGSRYQLSASQVLWECLQRCWHDNVFLTPLCHRFWKLTLQLLSRYAVWVDEVYNTEITEEGRKAAEEKRQQQAAAKMEPKAEGDGGERSTPSPVPSGPPPATLSQLVKMVSDIDSITAGLPEVFKEHIKPKLISVNCTEFTSLEEAMEDSASAIQTRLEATSLHVTQEVGSLCVIHLKGANDIPRLYRRTNREVPSKPSSYVSSTLKPLQTFLEDHQAILSSSRREDWTLAVISNITKEYLAISTELLTSVKKMEDSLKRLKALKKTGATAGTTPNQGMSDDDKIRLQLALDVRFYAEQIDSLGLVSTEISVFQELSTLVEATVNQSTSS